MPVLTTWKQKAKKHAGKRFGSKLAPDTEKKRKIDKVQNLSSPAQRIRYFSESEVSDSTRQVVCISADEEVDELGFGPTLSVPKLVSIVRARSPAKPCEDEGEDTAVYKELQELLDEPTPSGSKESLKVSSKSYPKLGMSSKGVRKAGSGSRIRDERIYSYDEIINCQEKLNDSHEFQFNIDDVEKEFRYFFLGGKVCTE